MRSSTRQRTEFLREANEKAKEILQEAKEVADETIRDFNKAGAGTDIRELEKKRQKVRDKISEKNNNLSLKADKNKPASKGIDPKKIKKGDSVKIVSMGLKGIVNTLPDAKGNLFVQCGIMRTQANIRCLVPVEEESHPHPFPETHQYRQKLRCQKACPFPQKSICWEKQWTKPLPFWINIWMMLIWHISPLSGLSTVREPAL